MREIPVIDLGGFDSDDSEKNRIVEAVRAACESVGFFCITGHGVSADAVSGIRAKIEAFFALADADKRAVAIAPGLYRGYIPLRAFSANDGGGAPDLYEGFKLHAETADTGDRANGQPLVPRNIWPQRPLGFRDAVWRYWLQVDALAQRLLRVFALALDLPEARLLASFARPMSNMTLLHYPPMAADADGYGIHPHKDSDAFTVLYPDPVGGLEVRPRGADWIVADPPPGALIVNIGDMLELWSGGRFVSTPHRVVNRSGAERYAFPYFAIPNEELSIAPLVAPRPGFTRPPLAVGAFMAELYRTNWRDQMPRDKSLDLGTLRR